MEQGVKEKPEQKSALNVPDVSELKNDLTIVAPDQIQIEVGEEPDLDAKAEEVVNTLLSVDVADAELRERSRAAVEQLASEAQTEAAQQSEMLKQPIHRLSERAADGGEVANSLVDLKIQVESLDPAKYDLEAGWFSRLLGYVPGVGTPVKRYFSKYESAQTVIDAIINSLESGKDQLRRDNITLTEDQKRMRELTKKLEKSIKLAQLIDSKLEYKLNREATVGEPKHTFISEELLFPLRQRIIDLQQQLAVNQQGLLATELVVRNNKELMRGVDRALAVTVNALQVAVTVALALANQKIVLDKVTALSETTSSLIANTAERLKTQGTEIHKAASASHLDMEKLKQAFADINEAMDDITQFRLEALPQMAETIVEMDRLTDEAEKKIKEKERAARVEPVVPIEVD